MRNLRSASRAIRRSFTCCSRSSILLAISSGSFALTDTGDRDNAGDEAEDNAGAGKGDEEEEGEEREEGEGDERGGEREEGGEEEEREPIQGISHCLEWEAWWRMSRMGSRREGSEDS